MNTLSTAPVANLSFHDFEIVESVGRCLASKLDGLRGKKIIFSSEDKNLSPIEGWGLKNSPNYAATITTVLPIKENTIVAAIDSSSVKLADTEEGSLYGVKCGMAIAYGGKALMHFKIGPVLFYLGESTIQESRIDDRLAKLVLFDRDLAKRLLRIRSERALQSELAKHFTDSIILVDGSLKVSIFEDRSFGINSIAENCVLHNNLLVGISKGTKLKVLERAGAPLAKVPAPAYIEVDVIIKGLIRNVIGNNLMVKFSKGSPVLRADIVGDRDEALGRLIGNDPVGGGYPETLRLAHYISTFTRTEVTCLRSHVLNNYDVTEIAADDIRRAILGSISV